MAINDPLGDMLTRIRNAQMRKKGKVTTPGSRIRANVLDVLKDEGYIRGYATTELGNGLGITIVSTSKGVMADHAAREANVGGEVLCKVF